MNASERYEKFTGSRQEKQKLLLALEGYFTADPILESQKRAYEKYLRMRIRPAVRILMKEEDTLALEQLWEGGFYDANLLEGFLKEARAEGAIASMVCFLRIKLRDVGFRREEWEI